MTIRKKILLWFLPPFILTGIITVGTGYYYVSKTIKQNIFNQLEFTVDELWGNLDYFLKEKSASTFDFGSDGFIRDCTEEITMKEARREYYTTTLNAHLITNKKSLHPNILEVFILNFNGKVIASTDEGRIGEDVSSEEYYLEAEALSAFADDPHYEASLDSIVIDFSTVLLSRLERTPVGIIVNRVKFEQQGDSMRGKTSAPRDAQENYSQLMAVNKARIMDFSSDGFIRDCTEEVNKREDRVRYYTTVLNTHLTVNKQPLAPDILEVFIVDFNGKVISSTEIGQIDRDISEEVYFSKTMKRGSWVNDLHYSPEFKQNTFEVARLVTSKGSYKPIGIIVNRYKGDSLIRVTRSGISEGFGQGRQPGGMGETGEMYIVNSDKLMITESRFIKDAVLKQVVDTEGVRSVLDNGVGMIGIYTNYRGVPILGVSLYLEEMDWAILAEKDVSEAFAPLVRLRNFTIITGIMGAIATVTISIFLATGITRPIKSLIKGTKRIASGNLESPIQIDKRHDEMKELGESFNLMMNNLRESLREKDILLREIYHRVKNNMQVISSLLRLQSRYIKDEKYIEMIKESQNRIKAMALIHEKLYCSKDLANIDFNDYIKNLVNDLFLSYKVSTGKVALNINIKTVSFGIDTAIPCGLIVNELISNSLKYAFPGGKDGEIKISLCKIADIKSEISAKADGRSPKSLAQTAGRIAPRPRPSLRLGRPGQAEMFELAVSDNGIGIPKDLDIRKTESLGLRLIINLAEKQLQGKVELDRNNGTKFQIKFKEAKYEERT